MTKYKSFAAALSAPKADNDNGDIPPAIRSILNQLPELAKPFKQWRPGKPAPYGFYRSTMYPDMLFKSRHGEFGGYANDNVRYRTKRDIQTNTTNDERAKEAKALASDDAYRYGSACWSNDWRGYHDWRATQGLMWWLEQEVKYPSADNDNAPALRKAAA